MHRGHTLNILPSGEPFRALAIVTLAGLTLAVGTNVPAASIQYLGENRLSGLSAAVAVQGHALAHTAQLLPLDTAGQVVGEGSVDAQLAQALFNLETALAAAGTTTDHLLKINFYVNSSKTAAAALGMLEKRFRAPARPAFSWVATPLPHPKALLALDAVAAVPGEGPSAVVRHAAGPEGATCVAVLPLGDAVYVSGQPEQGDLETATAKALESLLQTIQHVGLDRSQVVHVKAFLQPMQQAEVVRKQIGRVFAGQPLPPLTLVEWTGKLPVEIEMVAFAPPGRSPSQSRDTVTYFNPPGIKPSPLYSRVARTQGGQTVYLSGLYAEKSGSAEAQIRDIFGSLQSALKLAGSDLRHLVKATYYCADNDSSNMLNKIRPEFFDPRRPPAASKPMVQSVASADRSIIIDMIAVTAP
jgi:enamine deaminase RidA (YjgF/YER057c/UK114 family)